MNPEELLEGIIHQYVKKDAYTGKYVPISYALLDRRKTTIPDKQEGVYIPLTELEKLVGIYVEVKNENS